MENGRISVKNILKKALEGDNDSIKTLFSGFISDGESILDCGYLGVLGYILPEYSFWCLTESRICGLMIRRGGKLQFTSGFLRKINSMTFRQPSLLKLWSLLLSWFIFLLVLSVEFGPFLRIFLFPSIPLWVYIVLSLLIGLVSLRWIVRLFYRSSKSGCTFWMREKLPVYLFADRNNLTNAQHLISKFSDSKQLSG